MAKIDWSQERTKRDLCGWCTIGSMTAGRCDGGCFTRKDFSNKEKNKNKYTHVLDELKKIKNDRKLQDKREKSLQKELVKLNPYKIK